MADMDEAQFLLDLKVRAQQAGGISAWARKLRMDASNLRKIVAGKQRPGPKLLERLGYYLELRYRRGGQFHEPRTVEYALAQKPHKLSMIGNDFQRPGLYEHQPQKPDHFPTPNSQPDKRKGWF